VGKKDSQLFVAVKMLKTKKQNGKAWISGADESR
jgi:hypothetical protein